MINVELIKSKSKLSDEHEINRWFNRYVKLIDYATNNTQYVNFHRHHILPRSLFPEYKNEKTNILNLSYRLHYIAHYILYKLINDSKMSMAFHFMATNSISNSRLYSSSLKTLYDNRKGKVVAINRLTNIRSIVDVKMLGPIYQTTTVGKKWWLNESGSVKFTEQDLTDDGYINSHNFKCAPKNLYWTIDENGNRCRTNDESKKIKDVANWKTGFNKINKDSTKFLNLKTLEKVYINKNDEVPEYHYACNGFVKNKIIFYYNDVYYFKQHKLPLELHYGKYTFNKENIHEIKVPSLMSNSYKSSTISKQKKLFIEKNHDKSLYECGLRVYIISDHGFKFDLSKKFDEYDSKNCHN